MDQPNGLKRETLLGSRSGVAAVRTVDVGELDDPHRGIGGTSGGCRRGFEHRPRCPRRFQRQANAALSFKRADEARQTRRRPCLSAAPCECRRVQETCSLFPQTLIVSSSVTGFTFAVTSVSISACSEILRLAASRSSSRCLISASTACLRTQYQQYSKRQTTVPTTLSTSSSLMARPSTVASEPGRLEIARPAGTRSAASARRRHGCRFGGKAGGEWPEPPTGAERTHMEDPQPYETVELAVKPARLLKGWA